MKKYIVSMAIPMAILSLAIAFVLPSNTQAQVACPAGYTCTPIATQPVGCPVGYTCTPINSTSPAPTPSNTSTACYTIPSNLYIGSTGSSVSNLQTWLITNGFDIRNISLGLTAKGYYGTQTAGAVAKYLASSKYQNCAASQTSTTVNTNSSAPQISYIQGYGQGQNIVAPSLNARIYGNNFTINSNVTVFINGSAVTGQVISNGTQVNLQIPTSLLPGTYTLYVVDNSRQSNSVTVTVPSSVSSYGTFTCPTGQICNGSVNTPNQNPTNQSGTTINNCPTNYTWNGGSCVSSLTTVQPQTAKKATYLNITSPNGGEYLTPGSSYMIRWSTDSTYPIGVEIKKYDLNGTIPTINSLTLNGSNGAYTWNIPTNDSNFPTNARYKAAVYELAPAAAFQSNLESDSNDYFYLGNNTITPTVQAVSSTMPLQYSADGSYAYQDFYFTVQAGNSPIYVSKNPSLVVHLNSNIQGTAAAITAQNPAFSDGDASGAWIIPAGNQRTFKVTINMSDNTMGLIRMSNGSVGADQFYYSLSPNIMSITGENSVSVNVHTNW